MPDPANHIADLNQNLPDANDSIGDGDDEMRTIKRALVNDWGGINAPVYQDADLGGNGGSVKVTSQTASSWETRIAKNETDIAGLSAGGSFLPGMILLWSGTIGSIPAGWYLCDGANGTPDLRNRFIAGAGGVYAPDDTGGVDSQNTNTAGSHSHSVSVDGHALTEAEMPSHGHLLFNGDNVPIDFVSGAETTARQTVTADDRAYHMSSGTGNPQHGKSQLVGGGNPHTHTGSAAAAGDHSHSFDNRPQWYALAYIMFTGV